MVTPPGQELEVPSREHARIRTPTGELLDAWVYHPAGEPKGVLVMAMGIAGVKAAGTLPPFAEHFQKAGFASVVFDYRYWGDSEGKPRHLLLVQREYEDYCTVLRWVAGDDRLSELPRFVWGTSFSGMHAVEVAAAMPELAGAIAQCPIVDGLATARGGLDLRRTLRMMRSALADSVRAHSGRPPVYLPLEAPPGEAGLLSPEDARDGFAVMLPGDWPNEITARSLFDIPRHRPVRRAHRISCPILIVVQEQDAVAPVQPAVRTAARAQRGELFRGRGGHYDLYAGRSDHQDVLHVETDFLLRCTRDSAKPPLPGGPR